MRILWIGSVPAESDKTILVEGYQCFPPEPYKAAKQGNNYIIFWKGVKVE
ncbi:MAG TPA: hypothetical protein VJ991_03470 [Balneolales bacterium]|nr:hypothetical protein [Balneolales bacterium]